jgi:hypothetical protein
VSRERALEALVAERSMLAQPGSDLRQLVTAHCLVEQSAARRASGFQIRAKPTQHAMRNVQDFFFGKSICVVAAPLEIVHDPFPTPLQGWVKEHL